eukprot:TRINITY_DN1896_c2_g2_i1.p1 TRINITY_DN1896_c2_g2~~TRINITY_DN1896_c2_g2_i1.p1  ORF type:complete len:248 (+),score=52.84 TRINITY_DN1896_c2_g2_i1:81-824(+)
MKSVLCHSSAILLAVVAFAAISSGLLGFVSPFGHASPSELRGSPFAEGSAHASTTGASITGAAVAAMAAGTLAAAGVLSKRRSQKTQAKYTTQVILPALQWLKTGVKVSDLQPKELRAKTIGGNDVLIGKDESGALFCVANLCPHIGTPMSEGADVIGDVIVCPLHGSSFSTKTGSMIDWCPSPPIIGPLTGLIVDKKNLLIFECRTGLFGGGEIEVLVDTNAKKAYEADYWKGILDAQGKNDGTYY